MLKKILYGLLGLIIIALIGGGLFVKSIATRALPNYEGTETIQNLSEDVVIYRDEFAIPHIVAKNEDDLYRAVGFTLAQDRLWQMDLLRRVTLGQLSEIFGADLVDIDMLMRSLEMSKKSQKILQSSDPALLKALDAFADGVNQYIDSHLKKLPPEFTILGYTPEHWKPEQSVNLIGYMAWDLTMPYTAEIVLHKIRKIVEDDKFLELLPKVDEQETSVYPEFSSELSELDLQATLLASMDILEDYGVTVFEGSNNWAVSGEKSVTGMPIFANDMHLGLNAPGLWYQMHQTVAGKVNVTGLVLPGQPFIIAGHNERIAWGMTNVMVDDMDFYSERINPANPNQYEFMGEWKDFRIQPETIVVKGAEDVVKENRFTHRGPVISQFKKISDETITMKWLGNEMSNELRSVYLLNRAGNWDEFKDAVKTFTAVSQNIDYADVDGNIGLFNCSGIPIRKKGHGLNVVPGWTDEYDWIGIVPFDERAFSFNPESGYVSSANNKTVPNDYPYHISHWFALRYRIDRIRELLESKEKLSVDDFKTIQADFKSKFVEDVKPLFLKGLENYVPKEEYEKEILRELVNWDGTMDKNLRVPAVFETFYVKFVGNMLKDELGEDLYLEFTKSSYLARYFVDNIVTSGSSSWCDNVLTEEKEDFNAIVQKSFKDALAELRLRLGSKSSNWTWGDIHQLKLAHPLGGVKILDKLFGFNDESRPVSGSFHTVCPYAYKLSNPFVVNHGASHRHIFTPGNWDDSQTIIPTGNSGIPASDHYCDQTAMYVKNEYHNDYFSLNKIAENAKYTLKLTSK